MIRITRMVSNKLLFYRNLCFREKIFGYKDLIIKMYYAACSLKLYINISYSSKIDHEKYGLKVIILDLLSNNYYH